MGRAQTNRTVRLAMSAARTLLMSGIQLGKLSHVLVVNSMVHLELMRNNSYELRALAARTVLMSDIQVGKLSHMIVVTSMVHSEDMRNNRFEPHAVSAFVSHPLPMIAS